MPRSTCRIAISQTASGAAMSFRKDDTAYEAWLATQCDVVKRDIKRKHHLMKNSLHVPAGDLFPRVAGGSLGRPRYVAVAFWRGGQILREAKALVPSAWTWANGGKSRASHFLALANGKYRAPDPFLDAHDKFIFRRIAADSRKIELVDAGGSIR